MKHDLSDISYKITQYGENLDQILLMLQSQMRGRDAKSEMLQKVESAISQASIFEQTILHLIKERKFMK